MTKIEYSLDMFNILCWLSKFLGVEIEYWQLNCNTKKTIREKIIQNFKETTKIAILINVHILDEGINIPECDSVFITQPSDNMINIIQRMCRANRIIKNKTKNKIENLNHKISLLTKSNNKLKQNMTKNKYPKGMYFYILKDDNMYKIGYTKDLNKRLSTYNTGKANKAEYSYYKKTDCAKEIEECMKALLNKYIYKTNKEFYKCSLNKILTEVKKCLKIEKNCKNCKDIQFGGANINYENNIILFLLSNFEKEYNELILQYMIIL